MIVVAIALHAFEAVVFLTTSAADGSIGMAALLAVFRGHLTAAEAMLFACATAAFGQWFRGISPFARLCLLIPQQILLLITALGSVEAILAGSYADGILRSPLFIACDQLPRISLAGLYSVAILARIRLCDDG
jgi:hypothetical protein